MRPLYEDPHFTFSFADDRTIFRFHLEGVEAGQRVSVFKIDPGNGERLALLVAATVGEGGWVDLKEPSNLRARDAFVAAPEHSSLKTNSVRRLRPQQASSRPRYLSGMWYSSRALSGRMPREISPLGEIDISQGRRDPPARDGEENQLSENAGGEVSSSSPH
jgi:hypothetical protein